MLTLCALTLSACGSEDKADAADAGTAVTTRVTDATGTKVKVPATPERVVALSEMDLDASLALGVEPV
ncbi:ABC transporter substrate-binding protein, partial [Streptomyces sp. gb1(2016)]